MQKPVTVLVLAKYVEYLKLGVSILLLGLQYWTSFSCLNDI